MNVVFLPAVRLMCRLPMAHKFLIVCLCFAIPLVYMWVSLAGDRADSRAFSAKELIGVAQVRQASGLLNAAMVLRGTSIGLSVKTPGAEAKRDDALTKFEAQAQALEREIGAADDPLKLAPGLATVRAKAKALIALGTSAEPEAVITAGYALTDALQLVIEQASSESNLALDPDADTYYLMLTVTDALPRLQDAIGRMRALGAAAAHLGTPPYGMLQRLHQADTLTEEYLTRLAGALNRVAAANPEAVAGLDLQLAERIRKDFGEKFDQSFVLGEPTGGYPVCASTPAGGCRTTEYVASTPLNPTSTPPPTSPAPTTSGSNANSSSNTRVASRYATPDAISDASRPASTPKLTNSTTSAESTRRRVAPSVRSSATSKRRSSRVACTAASSTTTPASSVNRNTY